MTYLTKEEFADMGFHEVADFDKLGKRAEIAINLYTQGIYQRYIDFEKEVDYRKQAVKLAMGFQIAYLDNSGIMTADEKQTVSSMTIGRTRVDYGKQHGISAGQAFNLSLDAENALKQAGFSLIVGVGYDR
ncbi:hypothetical protein [Streptococcus salivarius]|uniref:hypothetical protein n=1 Tax=Streptococcus salivarius TaxID=1304 RepID=UPI003219AE76